MQKLFSLVAFVAASLSLVAAEKVVWTGDEPISWNPEVYQGSQFETPEGIFAGLKVQDTISVTVVAHIDEPQYVLTYKAGAGWEWTDLTSVTVADGLMTYIVESEQIATEIADRGLVFRGQGYNITQIAVATEEETPIVPKDSTDYDYTGLVETIVYEPEAPVAISWDSESWPGTKIDTRNISETMFAGLQEDNIIRVTVVEAEEDAQFSLQYKAGDDWSWTDLDFQLTTNEQGLFLAYKVESDDMAMLIADRGLIIQGIRYKISCISVFGTETLPQGIDETNANANAVKILRNGQLFILRNDRMYTIKGQIFE